MEMILAHVSLNSKLEWRTLSRGACLVPATLCVEAVGSKSCDGLDLIRNTRLKLVTAK